MLRHGQFLFYDGYFVGGFDEAGEKWPSPQALSKRCVLGAKIWFYQICYKTL